MTFVGASLPVSATLTEYPVFGGQALRYALAAAILLVVLRCSSATWVRVPVREWLRAALVSGVGLVAFSICVVEAARHVEPSVIGAVVGVSPIVFSLTGPLAERRRIRPQLVLAAATVCVGVVLVTGGGTGSVVGFLFATGALAGEVGFSLLAVPLLKRVSPLQLSAMACLCAPPLLILAGLTRPGELLRMPTPAEAAAIGYLAVVVTAVSFVCWYSGLRALGPERAGLFSGLMPIAALSTSVLLGQEGLSPLGLTGSVLVGLGICLGLSRYPHTPVPRSRARSCSSRT
ncbi:DMT family transporter [Nakamurella silvestris]|nr:DMT family transporter [Nakamurella silvestris]